MLNYFNATLVTFFNKKKKIFPKKHNINPTDRNQ